MKKKILIFIPLVLAALLFVFWEPLVSRILDSRLQGYCRDYLNGELHSEGIFKSEGHWVLEKPHIETAKRQFQAERVVVGMDFHPLKREVDLSVNIVNPKVVIGKKVSELQGFLAECIPQSLSTWAFKVNTRISVDEGEIAWNQQKGRFQLEGESNAKRKKGRLLLVMESEDQSENTFKMTVYQKNGQPLTVELHFSEVDCSSFCAVVQGIGIPFRGWQVKDGVLNGKIHVAFPGKGRPQIFGQAVLEGLVLENPEMKVKGEIQQARLDARTEKLVGGHRGVIGKFEISEEASFEIYNEKEDPYWQINQLLGGIYFQGRDVAVVNMEGVCTHLDAVFGLNVEGDLRYPDQNQASLDLAIALISPDEEVASARFVGRQLGALYNCAEIELKNVGKEEFTFVQTALGRYSNDWDQFRLTGGKVDASGIAYMSGYRMTDIKIDHVNGSQLKFELKPWEMAFKVGKVSGGFSINLLEENPLETVNAHFEIDEGNLTPWRFSDFKTDLKIVNGVMQKSIVKGLFAGMKGSIELDWMSPGTVLTFNFNGGTQQLIPLMPVLIQKQLETYFNEDHITVVAGMERTSGGGKVDGVVTVVGRTSDEVDTISFGFDLEKCSEPSPPLSPAKRLEAIRNFEIFESNLIDAETGIAGFKVRNGWFKAHNLSLEKYVSPFIFSDGRVVKGTGNFLGYLDQNQMAVEYDGRNIEFQWGDSLITMKRVVKAVNPDTGQTDSAAHFFDFATGTHYGSIPLREATYTNQNLGLVFSDIDANILFKNEKIDGAVFNSLVQLSSGEAFLKGLELDFVYDREGETLAVSNIHASLNSPKGYRIKAGEFNLESVLPCESEDCGDLPRSTAFARFNHAGFNLEVGNDEYNLIQLTGLISEKDDQRFLINLNDEKTHVGDIYPQDFQIVVKDWFVPETIHFSANLNLHSLFDQLRKIDRFRFEPTLKRIEKGVGNFQVDLNYDSGAMTFLAEGNNVSFGEKTYHTCVAEGRTDLEIWHIDRLQLDQMSLSGDFFYRDEKLLTESMRFRYGDSLMLNIDGELLLDEGALDGQVKDMKVSLPLLDEWPACVQFVEEWHPEGVLTGSGKIRVEMKEEAPGWRADAILNTHARDWEIKGLCFKDTDNVSCHFISDEGVTFRNIKTALKSKTDHLIRAYTDLEKGKFDFRTRQFKLENFQFEVPAQNLPWLATRLISSFPDNIAPAVADTISHAKVSGNVRGTYSLDVQPPYSSVRLTLEKGTYQFLNAEHDLDNFVLEFDPFKFRLITQYKYENHQFWTETTSTSPLLEFGELTVTDTKEDPTETLFISWKRDPEEGFAIHSAQGLFAGLQADLLRDEAIPPSSEAIYLNGRVKVDVNRASCLLPNEMRKKCTEWEIGDGFSLEGDWKILKSTAAKGDGKIHFSGDLKGEEFVFRGYQLDTLEAHLIYSPEQVLVNQLKVIDQAGIFEVDKIEIYEGMDEHWVFHMPEMTVSKFRPHILQTAREARPKLKKPLVIKELKVNSMIGNLSDSNSFTAEGELIFTNRSKKYPQNTILNIPAEILSRIGLDLAVLTPVAGTIQYELRDGMIQLKKFKNMYSERKLSKFYLPRNHFSTIDLEGNLDVQVRMKHHSLLFKLAEPFTVNIHGKVTKPLYRVRNEKKMG